MKNRYSWNFLVPEFSILEYSVWKFSVLGFYFPENSGIQIQLWWRLISKLTKNLDTCIFCHTDFSVFPSSQMPVKGQNDDVVV